MVIYINYLNFCYLTIINFILMFFLMKIKCVLNMFMF